MDIHRPQQKTMTLSAKVKPLLVVVLLLCNVYYLLGPTLQGSTSQVGGGSQAKTWTMEKDAKESSDSTGKLFSGEKIREYKGGRGLGRTAKTKQSLFSFHQRNCSHWAVVTTIFEPSEAVLGVASSLTGWCMVVVGDTKTPNNYVSVAGWTGRDDVVYLSIKEQTQLLRHPLVEMTPVRSFARKNLGFLFAILHGAQIIYDFDDDNVLKQTDEKNPVGSSFLQKFSRTDKEGAQTRVVKLSNDYQHPAFNPFPLMQATDSNHNNMWPRGFPIEMMKNEMSSGMKEADLAGEHVPLSSIGVVQSVCDGDPDVDAIYRMTHQLPVYFNSGPGASPLLIPAKSYSPYNAQATIHRYNAFWGLYLPWTMTGRVSDIWRSYITQRIMKDIGVSVVYSPPFVTHHRNQHNYLADLEAETHLYLRTSKLLNFLSSWEDNSSTLPDRIEQLWIDLYERDYIGMEDVEGVQAWLSALEQAGYQFPVLPKGRATETREEVVLIEDQPISRIPRFNLGGAQGDKTYREFLETYLQTAQSSNNKTSAWTEWLKGTNAPANRPVKRIAKIVLMTKDEWPLLQEWTLYHGELIGFENLYILDGSTDPKCLAFLIRARDEWGANVVFTKANLNRLARLIDSVFKFAAPSSDIMLKVDTDEFLTMWTNSTSCKSASADTADCTLSPFGVVEYLNSEDFVLDGRKLKIGYRTMSENPSKEACATDRASSEKVRMLAYSRPQPTNYKSFYDSRTFDRGDLGSHVGYVLPPFDEVEPLRTRLSIIHAHGRCYETETSNNRKAVISHNFINETDSEEEQIRYLHKKYIGENRDVCNMTSHKEFEHPSAVSGHKMIRYAKYLECREAASEAYYAARKPGWSNPDLQEFFDHIKNKYAVPSL